MNVFFQVSFATILVPIFRFLSPYFLLSHGCSLPLFIFLLRALGQLFLDLVTFSEEFSHRVILVAFL